jgi:hypothetical protein
MRKVTLLGGVLPSLLVSAVGLSASILPAHGQVTVPDRMTESVASATGLYFTGPFVEGRGSAGIIELLRNSRMDTAVIDLKDATGRVHHDTAIPELEASETGMMGDARTLLRELHDAGIRSVARIVCFNDPLLAPNVPDRAILDSRERFHGRVWTSWGTGGAWLDLGIRATRRWCSSSPRKPSSSASTRSSSTTSASPWTTRASGRSIPTSAAASVGASSSMTCWRAWTRSSTSPSASTCSGSRPTTRAIARGWDRTWSSGRTTWMCSARCSISTR